MDASDLNLPSIGIAELSGSQTVERTVTSVAKDGHTYNIFVGPPPESDVIVTPSPIRLRTFNVSVDAPPGFSVQVMPSSLRLMPGQSATFQATITDVSATIGEWAFGSLTWRDKTDSYKVYSPIAVRASP